MTEMDVADGINCGVEVTAEGYATTDDRSGPAEADLLFL